MTVPKKYISFDTHDAFVYLRTDSLLNLSRYLTCTIKVRQRVGHTPARLKYWLHSRNNTCLIQIPGGASKTRSPPPILILSITPSRTNQLFAPSMAGKHRGKPKQGREDASEASSTAVEPSTTRAGTPTVDVTVPGQSHSSDPGTPLPDDPNVLKENVKGLKSQLRRHKRQVALSD